MFVVLVHRFKFLSAIIFITIYYFIKQFKYTGGLLKSKFDKIWLPGKKMK